MTARMVCLCLLTACAQSESDQTRVAVTNANASGRGSFAAAVNAANRNARISHIDFKSALDTIPVAAPTVFSGSQELFIHARGAVVSGRALPRDASVIVSEGGGDIAIDSLTVVAAPDAGIKITVPGAARDTLRVTLRHVHVAGSGGHGVIVNDQTAYYDDPESDSEAGSAASLHIVISSSSFQKNGFAALDRDGVRINEGGAGDLRVVIDGASVVGNGGDGVEIDERAEGSIFVDVNDAAFLRNGNFSNEDFDDGLDIDETGAGDITGIIKASRAIDNFDQGFDFNENAAGDIRIDLNTVEAIGNRQAGIDYSEDDEVLGGGDLIVHLTGVVARRNGSAGAPAGVVLREAGAGDLRAITMNVQATDNLRVNIAALQGAPGVGTWRTNDLNTHRATAVETSGVAVLRN